MRRILFILLSLCSFRAFAEDVNALCQSSEGSSSCGQCIKQHPNCAWCRDPHAKVGSRCMEKTMLTADKCNPNYVYSPVTELKISPHNLKLEATQRDQKSIVQMEPQQVVLRMKPGDTLEVPFKYIHKKNAGYGDVKDFGIQTSDFKTTGVNIDFIIECNGEQVTSRQCAGIKDNQIVNFKAKVTLQKCSASGDIAISVGVYGHRSVSAIFVTPLCGCECEKLQQQEKNSPLCYQHGNLICGQCQCQPGRGGDNCDCPLSLYGVQTAEELNDKCREQPGAPVCGGAGKCKCGQCQCDNPAITGKFCSCDHKSCPLGVYNQQTCSGNGVCECGKCNCEDGFERDDCSCTKDTNSCMEGGKVCSDNGKCECGKCVCNEGFTGATCNAVEVTEDDSSMDSSPVDGADSGTDGNGEEDLPPVQPEADGAGGDMDSTLQEEPLPVDDDSSELTENAEQTQFAFAPSLFASLILTIFSLLW